MRYQLMPFITGLWLESRNWSERRKKKARKYMRDNGYRCVNSDAWMRRDEYERRMAHPESK